MTPLSTSRDDTLFLSPKDVTDIINHQGMVATLTGMAHYIEQDFYAGQVLTSPPGWPAIHATA